MKTITITIQPCKSPVTITIHADGVVTTKQRTKPRKTQDDILVDRSRMYMKKMNGYCRMSEFTLRFKGDRRILAMRDDIVKKLKIRVFNVSIPKGRPATFFVLPEAVPAFTRFVKKQGWEIIG